MGLLEDVGEYLAAGALSLTMGTNLFGSKMPDSPDAVTVLYDSPGLGDEETFGDEIEQPGFQIVARCGGLTGAADARAHLYAVRARLKLVVNMQLVSGGTRWLRIVPQDSPFLLHRDERDRVLYACNFQAMRESE